MKKNYSKLIFQLKRKILGLNFRLLSPIGLFFKRSVIMAASNLFVNYLIPFFLIILFGFLYFQITGYHRAYFTTDQILADVKDNLKNKDSGFQFYKVDFKGFGDKSLVVLAGLYNRRKYDEIAPAMDKFKVDQNDSPSIYIFSKIQKNFFENLIFPEAIYRKESQIEPIVNGDIIPDLSLKESQIEGDQEMSAINEIDLYNSEVININNSQEGIIIRFGDIRYIISTVPEYYGLLYYDNSDEKFKIKPIISEYDKKDSIQLLCSMVEFQSIKEKKNCNINGYSFDLFDLQDFYFLNNGKREKYWLTSADSDINLYISGGNLQYDYNIWQFSGECHACEQRRLHTEFEWIPYSLEFTNFHRKYIIK